MGRRSFLHEGHVVEGLRDRLLMHPETKPTEIRKLRLLRRRLRFALPVLRARIDKLPPKSGARHSAAEDARWCANGIRGVTELIEELEA